jgi:peroxiredoxin
MRGFKIIGLLLVLLIPMFAHAATPDIPVKDMQGHERNMSDYIGRGDWTVVVIWAHNCHVCNQEIHQMSFFHDEHKGKGVKVLGVSVDGWAKQKQAQGFVKEHELEFPNLIIEPQQEMMIRFGGGRFVGTPTFYVYTPKGELVARNIGPVGGDTIAQFIKSYNKQAQLQNQK